MLSKKFRYITSLLILSLTTTFGLFSAAKIIEDIDSFSAKGKNNAEPLETDEINGLIQAIINNQLDKANELIASVKYNKIWDVLKDYLPLAAAQSKNRKTAQMFITKDIINSGIGALCLDEATKIEWTDDYPAREVVEYILNLGISTDAINYVFATTYKEGNIIKLLMYWGADVNATTRFNESALKGAIISGYDDIACLLIDYGAYVNFWWYNNETTALISSVNKSSPKLVEALLKAGINLNAQNKDKETALDIAKRIEKPEFIDLLTKEPARRAKLVENRKLAIAKILYGQLNIPKPISNIIGQYAVCDFEDIPQIAAAIQARKETVFKLFEGRFAPLVDDKSIAKNIGNFITKIAVERYEDIPEVDREL